MRLAVASVLISFSLPAGASENPDCKDFQARYKAMSAAIDARAPGLETDQKREKAEDYLKTCTEDDDRLVRELPCIVGDARPSCRQ